MAKGPCAIDVQVEPVDAAEKTALYQASRERIARIVGSVAVENRHKVVIPAGLPLYHWTKFDGTRDGQAFLRTLPNHDVTLTIHVDGRYVAELVRQALVNKSRKSQAGPVTVTVD